MKPVTNFHYEGAGWARIQIFELNQFIENFLTSYSDKQLRAIKSKALKGDPALKEYLKTTAEKILAERANKIKAVHAYYKTCK